uniref:Uncharacterized protein n=1 Tax=Helianthus annuus TaxID=4232 RepID=A0A251SIT5_HELAN
MALSAFGSSESNVLIIIPADLGKCSHFPRKSEYSAEVLSRSGRSISDGGIGGNPAKDIAGAQNVSITKAVILEDEEIDCRFLAFSKKIRIISRSSIKKRDYHIR